MASMPVQQALWLGASVPVPVARPVPVPNIHVAWKLVIETEYEPVMRVMIDDR